MCASKERECVSVCAPVRLRERETERVVAAKVHELHYRDVLTYDQVFSTLLMNSSVLIETKVKVHQVNGHLGFTSSLLNTENKAAWELL